MKSITDRTLNQLFIERIEKLNTDSQAQWGKMNVSQMLAHCSVGFKVAFGEIIPQSNFFMKLIGRTFKKQIFAREDFRKNSPTGKEYIISDEKDFENEKALLVSYVNKCAESGMTFFTKEPHPFFGKLSDAEWDGLMYRHLDHHLKQFGV